MQRRRVVYLTGVAADVELIGAVRAALRGAAQPELARPMQAYMKSATPFLGVRVPMMRTLTRAEAKLRPFTTSADLVNTVLRLWREAGYREERYAAIALLDTLAARRLRDPAVLQTLRELIVTGAWWDYVDELAHRVGDLLLGWQAGDPPGRADMDPQRRPVAAAGINHLPAWDACSGRRRATHDRDRVSHR